MKSRRTKKTVPFFGATLYSSVCGFCCCIAGVCLCRQAVTTSLTSIQSTTMSSSVSMLCYISHRLTDICSSTSKYLPVSLFVFLTIIYERATYSMTIFAIYFRFIFQFYCPFQLFILILKSKARESKEVLTKAF